MNSGRRFFISYAHGDQPSTRLLAELKSRLTRRGHQVSDDTDIPLAVDWNEELDRCIRQSDVFIVLVSDKSVSSTEVRKEVLRADASRTRCGWPRILPIRVNYPHPIGGELGSILTTLQWYAWESPADTLHLVERIDETVAAYPPRPETDGSAAAAEAAAPAIPDRRSIRRGRVIRTVAALALLLLIAATAVIALRLRARTLMQSTSRFDVDRGLVISALAGALTGSREPDETRSTYRDQNYAMLLATLRGGTLMSGRELAVSPGQPVSIVGGGLRWACDSGSQEWACSPAAGFTDVPLENAAFVSPGVIVTRDFDGEVLRRDLQNGTQSRMASGTTALAAEGGEVVVGFETEPFVTLYDRNDVASSPRSGITGAVASVAFGPCRPCVSLLGKDGQVAVWDRSDGSVTPLVAPRRAAQIAATATGARLAVAWSDGNVSFYDATRGAPITADPDVDAAKITAMTISEDGRDVALVHEGDAILVSSSGAVLPLVASELRPIVTAAAFAHGVLFTRTPVDVRIWSRDRLLLGDESAPANEWRKWRKQLGLTFRDLRAAPGDPIVP